MLMEKIGRERTTIDYGCYRLKVRPTAATFDEAQAQIFTLMQRDSYPRFVTLLSTLLIYQKNNYNKVS